MPLEVSIFIIEKDDFQTNLLNQFIFETWILDFQRRWNFWRHWVRFKLGLLLKGGYWPYSRTGKNLARPKLAALCFAREVQRGIASVGFHPNFCCRSHARFYLTCILLCVCVQVWYCCKSSVACTLQRNFVLKHFLWNCLSFFQSNLQVKHL